MLRVRCIAFLPDPSPPRQSSVAALTASNEGPQVRNPAVSLRSFYRLALVLYDDQRFGAAEATLKRGSSSSQSEFSTELLLLSKAQVRILYQFHVLTRFKDACTRSGYITYHFYFFCHARDVRSLLAFRSQLPKSAFSPT